ncbi:hypothetical protein GOP47_0007374 [Adiantum capillus-veneris]|uniref:non-specific serine/threonine protein kinase n=1 Tax=Adiantum capillus-veneris TaxID=13818 RepID=A0A9D4V0K5_ADICA|nr:hypothetical protein GOP47_0007374 [Adiantum capillus-veneris]
MPRFEAERSDNLRTRVGKYELGRVLGEGTFAKVKYARNVETGQSVAIKVIDKDTVFKHKLVHQIKTEISTMKLVKHPNVIQLYEVMASKSKIYFVLEYVAGGELFDKIARKGRLKEERARRYFQQLIHAVDFCHSRGIYHRDLKPENLLLDSRGNLKISDFGLSALAEQRGEDGLFHTTCGTPNYVAPEVIVHKGYDGARADVWSCGVILFVLMAGYLPFDDSNLMHLYRKIHRAELKYPPWFSLEACKLISRILNPNPRLRATIPEILKDSWFTINFATPNIKEDIDVGLNEATEVFNVSKELIAVGMDDKRPQGPAQWNAFDLISLSNKLSLSKVLGKIQGLRKQAHFTSRYPASEIITKMEETAKPLGFRVLRDNYKMRLQGSEAGRKGHLSVAAEVFEVAPSLFVVEVQKACGDTLEYQKFYQKFSKGLEDIVWKSESGADIPFHMHSIKFCISHV